MSDSYRSEIRVKMTDLQEVKDLWNMLAHTMQEGFACHTYEWFECWYQAFCKSGNERIVLVYEGDQLRAIFPGMVSKKNVRGLTCTVFSYAGNGHSPRCGVIAAPGDVEAIKTAIHFVNSSSVGIFFDFYIFMGVMSGTDTHLAIQQLASDFKIHVEHSFDSPTCNISEGWEKYLTGRSKSLKDRYKKSINRSLRLGSEPIFEIISQSVDIELIIDRLNQLDSKTWQHNNGTGLFSIKENSIFYSCLIKKLMPLGLIDISFIKLGNKDAAFYLQLLNDDIVFSIKTGFNPEFAKCSPGILAWYYLTKYYADNNFREYDLIGEKTDEKMNWATHCQKHLNFWIFNTRSSLKGAVVQKALKLHALVKMTASKCVFSNSYLN